MTEMVSKLQRQCWAYTIRLLLAACRAGKMLSFNCMPLLGFTCPPALRRNSQPRTGFNLASFAMSENTYNSIPVTSSNGGAETVAQAQKRSLLQPLMQCLLPAQHESRARARKTAPYSGRQPNLSNALESLRLQTDCTLNCLYCASVGTRTEYSPFSFEIKLKICSAAGSPSVTFFRLRIYCVVFEIFFLVDFSSSLSGLPSHDCVKTHREPSKLKTTSFRRTLIQNSLPL